MSHAMLNALLQTPSLYGSKVSPDLRWVAWTWANVGEHADVYIAPTDGSISPQRLTNLGEDTHVISWTQDSRFVVVGHDYEGDERVRLYKIDRETKEATPLTEAHPSYYIRGGQITNDGTYLIYGANFDTETNEEIEETIIYKQDLKTGERIRLAKPEKASYLFPELNSKGTHILYQRNDRSRDGEQIWIVDIDEKADREILNFGDTIKVFASWHPNGEEVVFVSETNGYRRVGIYHLHTKEIEWIIDDPSRNIEEAVVPPGSSLVAITEIQNAKNVTTLFDRTTKKETPFSSEDTMVPRAHIDETHFVSTHYNSRHPRDLVLHDATGIIRSISRVFERVSYSADDLAKAESYTWQSTDGMKIQGWLYRPTGRSAGTIILVHGGPTAHSEDAWDRDIQYFVSEGFVVLDPNYRGSTGFGLSFQDAIKVEGWGGKEQDDTLEGIKSLIRDGIAEPGKIGITGTSYGGYSSWFAITHFPREYVAAAIPICGMTDLVVDYETTRPDIRGYSEEMMGGTPSEAPDRYYNGSPINFISQIEGDLLIVQGAKDPNVTLENVREVEAILKREGKHYEKLVFEDEGHGIGKPQNQKILLERSVDFFRKAFTQP